MNNSEIYANVRKAYRLLYEVQDSIVNVVDYIKTRIACDACYGRQLFSNPISRTTKALHDNYATDYRNHDMWSWDYFATYLYMYYYPFANKDEKCSCFTIIQVMDDGFVVDGKNCPKPEGFRPINESESYLLVSYALWDITKRAVYFDFDGTGNKDECSETKRIAEWIKENNGADYIVKEDGIDFIVRKVPLEKLDSKEAVDEMLVDFNQLIKDKTGRNILSE